MPVAVCPLPAIRLPEKPGERHSLPVLVLPSGPRTHRRAQADRSLTGAET
jgi:hypothetical protein